MDTILFYFLCIVLFGIGFNIIVVYIVYRRNVDRLNASMASRTVKPAKSRFVLAWFVFELELIIPATLILWFFTRDEVYTIAWSIIIPVLLFLLGIMSVVAYPYYTIAVLDDRINGPTRWGWLWKRIDIRFDEIDRERTLGQRLGRKLGMTVIHSRYREKILTLGLDEEQLAELVRRGE